MVVSRFLDMMGFERIQFVDFGKLVNLHKCKLYCQSLKLIAAGIKIVIICHRDFLSDLFVLL